MTTVPVSARWREASLVGVGAVLLVVVQAQGIATPSLWYDEAATYSGASRPLAALGEMVGRIDAVHGTFYALLHPIATAFGPDAFALRFPSTVSVGIAAVLVYLLARSFGTPWSAAAAALVFAGLGRTAWMATEARSFALATALSTLLTLLLVRALRSRSRQVSWAIAYGVTAVVGTYVFLYVSLVVVAHGVTLLLLRRRRRTAGPLVAVVMALALSAPVGLASVAQRGQLGGVFPVTARTFEYVFVGEFFHREGWQSALAWVAVVAAVLTLLLRRWMRPGSPTAGDPGPPGAGPVSLVSTDSTPGWMPWLVLVPWLILPTLAIVAVSVLGPSIYQPRALVISAPALCVLLAELVRRAFGGVTAVVVAIAVTAAGAGAFTLNRELTAKNADWPVVAAELQQVSAAGDGVLYSTPIDYRTWPSLIPLVHPREVAGLVDVTLLVPGRERPALFDERSAPADAVGTMSRLDRVFFVYSLSLTDADRADDRAALTAAGLRLDAAWTGPLTGVETWVRGGG